MDAVLNSNAADNGGSSCSIDSVFFFFIQAVAAAYSQAAIAAEGQLAVRGQNNPLAAVAIRGTAGDGACAYELHLQRTIYCQSVLIVRRGNTRSIKRDAFDPALGDDRNAWFAAGDRILLIISRQRYGAAASGNAVRRLDCRKGRDGKQTQGKYENRVSDFHQFIPFCLWSLSM